MTVQPPTLLLVEDFSSDRELYRRYLCAGGDSSYRLLEAETVRAGLEFCRTEAIDAILLDYLLPDANGLEFLESLQAQSNGNSPPVVMVTNEGNETIAVQAMKLGAEDYLVKRYLTPEVLQVTVRSAIENARLRLQLRHQENQFRVSLENMLDCFGIYSAIRDESGQILDFRIDYMNAAALELNRMTRMAIGRGLCELLPNHRETGLFDEYCQLVETGKPLIKESLVYSDLFGQQHLTRAFDIHASKLGDGFVASWRDVTEQKRQQKALEQQARRLEMVDEAVIVRDSQSGIVAWNRAAEELYGWQREEAFGHVTHRFLRTQFPVTQMDIDALLHREGRWEGELVHTCKDGSQRIVESRHVLVRDEAGNPTGFLEVNRDITDRKRVEAVLWESEDRFQSIAQAVPSLLFEADAAGHNTWSSESWCQFTGQTREQATGEGWAAAVHPEDLSINLKQWTRSLQQGIPFEAKQRLRRFDGSYRWVLARAVPIRDRQGQVYRWVGSVTDIDAIVSAETERERLLSEAEAANRSKDEFVAMVAHELRSPLNSILGWAKLLRTRQFNAETTAKALETIERNTQAQAQLVEDLLDISRMVSGKLAIIKAPVSLMEVIEAAIDQVRLQAEAKQIRLDPQLTLPPLVSGDCNRLQQVVVNLLTNAIKFTPEQGQIQIELAQIDTQVQLQVRDSGKGIAPEFLPCLFKRFQQGQQNTGPKDGLGLGLAIVKNLVELHEGTITAESPGVGLGATFTVRLPMLSTTAIAPKRIPTPMHPDALAGVRILAVDDEPDMLSLIQFVLEECGAVVQTTLSLRAAVALFPNFEPDILLSDIAMPEGTGYDLVQALRQYELSQPAASLKAPIPAIALTAYASATYEERSLQAGFQKHLTKPVEPEVLVSAIAELVELRRL